VDCRQSDGDQKIKTRLLHLTGSPQLENGVTVRRFLLQDKDGAECGVCGNELASWNSTEVPSYSLIEAKSRPPASP
jgi:hypothetical protein